MPASPAMPESDALLLRRYLDERSQAAFAELVRRHLTLVWHAALRQTGGNSALAEEVAQTVFCELARRAASLDDRPVLAGWLYTSTRFAAQKARRAESRRRQREHAAHLMNEPPLRPAADPAAADWARLRPVIDDALHTLDDRDREAVLMRFFEGQPFADIGARLAIGEDTARKRVARALDKMQAALARRGVTSTAAALGAALTTQAGVAAPAGLVASVTGAAVATGAAAAAGGAVTLFMSLASWKTAAVLAFAAAGATGYIIQGRTNDDLTAQIAALRTDQQTLAALQQENQRLQAAATEVADLRHDDAELKQLSQRIAEVKKASEEKARTARLREQANAAARLPYLMSAAKELHDRIIETDTNTQAEVDRLNKEGNALVIAFKDLIDRSRNASLTDDERAAAKAASAARFAEIQAKQKEIKDLVAHVREVMQKMTDELHLVDPAGTFSAPLPALAIGNTGTPSGQRQRPASSDGKAPYVQGPSAIIETETPPHP